MTLKQQLERIAAKLTPKIDNALEHEVADAIRIEEAETISEVVYDVYTPEMYRRRGDMGGFADPYNIEAEVKNGRLTVKNTTEPNPGGTMNDSSVTTVKYLDQLIEYGHGSSGWFYDFTKSSAAFMRPRPFTAKTIEHLRKNKAHLDALKVGLKRLGIKTE